MKKVQTIMISLTTAATIALGSTAIANQQGSGYQAAKFFDLTYQGQVRQYSSHPYTGMKFPARIRAPGHKMFVFSPRHRAWAAYSADGSKVATGIANGGASFCDDIGKACTTPAGMYAIHTKKGYDCVSKKFPVGVGGAPMPYCMFFRGGYAIHGSPYLSNNNSSHGCIRVTTSAAQWLSNNFMSIGTKVLVLSY